MKVENSKLFYRGFLSLILLVGLIWLRSGFIKLTEGTFAGNLSSVLVKFASSNPYPFYKNFLQNTAIPNSVMLGNLVMWGEILTSLAITISVIFLLLYSRRSKAAIILLLAGLSGGSFLNLNFWLASAWTGAAADALNVLMMFTQLIGLVTLLLYLKTMKNPRLPTCATS